MKKLIAFCSLIVVLTFCQAEAAVWSQGSLVGWLDGIRQSGLITGWIADKANLGVPVNVDILVDGNVIATPVVASSPRPDVQYPTVPVNSGVSYQLPPQYLDGKLHRLQILITGTSMTMGNSLQAFIAFSNAPPPPQPNQRFTIDVFTPPGNRHDYLMAIPPGIDIYVNGVKVGPPPGP